MNGPISILFLCRTNDARSIMAEAVLNHLGAGRIRAVSAGSMPASCVHPETVRTLSAKGYSTQTARTKSWDVFAQSDTPPAHLVITVCDDVAEETCPPWPGRPARAHWEIADPVAETDRHDGDSYAFRATLAAVEERVRILLARLENAASVNDLEVAARVP